MRIIGVICALMLLSGCLQASGGAASDDVDTQATAEANSSKSDTATAQEDKSVSEAPEDIGSAASGAAASDVPREETQHRGLFALFGGKRNTTAAIEVEKPQPVITEDPAKEDAIEAPDDKPVIVNAIDRRPARHGLFGPRRQQTIAPTLAPGTVLPFGEIGVACGVRGHALGKEVDRFPVRGKGYRLFDSDPASTKPRTYFLTGFKDGCARQFTAALALIGSPVLHEQMRYDPSNKDISVTEADKAYEQIKRRICKIPKGEPCPEKHIAALEKGMAFVTLYKQFGNDSSWEEVLLHQGKVAGTSLRKR